MKYCSAFKRREIMQAAMWMNLRDIQFSSAESLSRVQLFATPWIAARQGSLSITNFWSLLKLMSIKSVMPSNHLILCPPLLLLPSIFPSIRVFSMSQFFACGGQRIGVSASASDLPVNIQDWFHQLGNSKIFRSYVPGIMDKDSIYLVYFLY